MNHMSCSPSVLLRILPGRSAETDPFNPLHCTYQRDFYITFFDLMQDSCNPPEIDFMAYIKTGDEGIRFM